MIKLLCFFYGKGRYISFCVYLYLWSQSLLVRRSENRYSYMLLLVKYIGIAFMKDYLAFMYQKS